MREEHENTHSNWLRSLYLMYHPMKYMLATRREWPPPLDVMKIMRDSASARRSQHHCLNSMSADKLYDLPVLSYDSASGNLFPWWLYHYAEEHYEIRFSMRVLGLNYRLNSQHFGGKLWMRGSAFEEMSRALMISQANSWQPRRDDSCFLNFLHILWMVILCIDDKWWRVTELLSGDS